MRVFTVSLLGLLLGVLILASGGERVSFSTKPQGRTSQIRTEEHYRLPEHYEQKENDPTFYRRGNKGFVPNIVKLDLQPRLAKHSSELTEKNAVAIKRLKKDIAFYNAAFSKNNSPREEKGNNFAQRVSFKKAPRRFHTLETQSGTQRSSATTQQVPPLEAKSRRKRTKENYATFHVGAKAISDNRERYLGQKSSASTSSRELRDQTKKKEHGENWHRDQREEARIRRMLLAGKIPASNPIGIFLGGGTASGKSSVWQKVQHNFGVETDEIVIIDTDVIMFELEGYIKASSHKFQAIRHCAADKYHTKATVYADRILEYVIEHRYNFVFDTTLKNKEKALLQIEKASIAFGERVYIIGVTVPTVVAVKRAYTRASNSPSGRWVPLSVIVESHARFSGAFKSYMYAVKPKGVYLIDNSENDCANSHKEKTSPGGERNNTAEELYERESGGCVATLNYIIREGKTEDQEALDRFLAKQKTDRFLSVRKEITRGNNTREESKTFRGILPAFDGLACMCNIRREILLVGISCHGESA